AVRSCLARAIDLLGRIAKGAEDPVVQTGRAGLGEEVRAHVLPHDLAVPRDLEDAPVASLTDQRVVVRQPLCARDVGTEKFEERLIGVLPDDRARAWIDLDDARERGGVIAAVRAIVEDEEVSTWQRSRIVLLREGRAAELPDDLPRGALDHDDCRDVSE